MATPMEEDPPVIDEDMQSRQMAVYGRESMQKLAKASILISGLNGLGAEIAKNVILSNPAAVSAAAHALKHATAALLRSLHTPCAHRGGPTPLDPGCAQVTLQDSKAASVADCGAHFYLSEADEGKNRAEACHQMMQELNPGVRVTTIAGGFPADLSGYSVAVAV